MPHPPALEGSGRAGDLRLGLRGRGRSVGAAVAGMGLGIDAGQGRDTGGNSTLARKAGDWRCLLEVGARSARVSWATADGGGVARGAAALGNCDWGLCLCLVAHLVAASQHASSAGCCSSISSAQSLSTLTAGRFTHSEHPTNDIKTSLVK